MELSQAEKDLDAALASLNQFPQTPEGFRQWVEKWGPLEDRVQEERRQKGLRPFPEPPLPLEQ